MRSPPWPRRPHRSRWRLRCLGWRRRPCWPRACRVARGRSGGTRCSRPAAQAPREADLPCGRRTARPMRRAPTRRTARQPSRAAVAGGLSTMRVRSRMRSRMRTWRMMRRRRRTRRARQRRSSISGWAACTPARRSVASCRRPRSTAGQPRRLRTAWPSRRTLHHQPCAARRCSGCSRGGRTCRGCACCSCTTRCRPPPRPRRRGSHTFWRSWRLRGTRSASLLRATCRPSAMPPR
mmetsp:Transcript_72333/g.217366  ORF Transcript_72333/g.217366 Transcript_72333/m.217366 type:complete len:236 (+) Transcript_72333:987-1694(+)